MIADVHCRILLFKESIIGESLKTCMKFASFISVFKILHQSSHVETCNIVLFFNFFFCKNQLVSWSLGKVFQGFHFHRKIFISLFSITRG